MATQNSPPQKENDMLLLNNKEMLQEFKVTWSLRFRHSAECQETVITDIHGHFS